MEAWNFVERDWSSLPSDVLNLIAKKLYEIIDFVRFRAVCIAWRFSTSVTDLPPQFPWIYEGRHNTDETYLRFFSITSNKIYSINVEKSMNKYIDKPCDGYYVARVYDNDDSLNNLIYLSLINPLNNDEIPLPVPRCNNDILIVIEHVENQLGEHEFCCAFCDPDSEIKVVSYRLGQECWCELKSDFNFIMCNNFFQKNMLFSVNCDTGVTNVTDIASDTIVYVVPPIKSHFTNLGEFMGHSGKFRIVEVSGDIFGVFVCDGSSDFLYDVHHLDMTNNGFPYWIKVKNIRDYAIFWDDYSCVVLKADGLVGIEANCIYLLKSIYVNERRLYEVKKFNIDTCAEEYRSGPLMGGDLTWFVPNLQHLCPQ